jgi:hypothetical protein
MPSNHEHKGGGLDENRGVTMVTPVIMRNDIITVYEYHKRMAKIWLELGQTCLKDYNKPMKPGACRTVGGSLFGSSRLSEKAVFSDFGSFLE